MTHDEKIQLWLFLTTKTKAGPLFGKLVVFLFEQSEHVESLLESTRSLLGLGLLLALTFVEHILKVY